MKRTATNLIVVHCSATPPARDVGVETIRGWHLKQGWKNVGYHFVIKRDGTVQPGRPMGEVGAHVAGHNATSVGICLVGGVAADGKTAQDNFTKAQKDMLRQLLRWLLVNYYPHCRVCGHRDLSPDLNGDGEVSRNEWIKECPSFDVGAWLRLPENNTLTPLMAKESVSP